MKIEASRGETLEIPVGKIGGSFKITGVYFNDNLDKAYIYLQNTGKANFKLEQVYFGTEEVTSETRFLSQEVIDQSSQVVKYKKSNGNWSGD